MTVEQAKTKWCPFVRFEIGPNDSRWQSNAINNRGDFFDDVKGSQCIADKCMAWRWGSVAEINGQGYCGMVRG